MKPLEKLYDKIDEYRRKYRKESLEPIKGGKLYNLDSGGTGDPISGIPCECGWPAQWPHSDKYGIYAILSHEKLLYIGKASQQYLGHRLSSYFHYGEKGEFVTDPKHSWTIKPTHVITWAVPDDMFFEASALEEYLIRELAHELSDNVIGVKG